jgi:hypothetical protein
LIANADPMFVRPTLNESPVKARASGGWRPENQVFSATVAARSPRIIYALVGFASGEARRGGGDDLPHRKRADKPVIRLFEKTHKDSWLTVHLLARDRMRATFGSFWIPKVFTLKGLQTEAGTAPPMKTQGHRVSVPAGLDIRVR